VSSGVRSKFPFPWKGNLDRTPLDTLHQKMKNGIRGFFYEKYGKNYFEGAD